MKASHACKIIGYALEDASQEGTIQVFAHLSESAAAEVNALQAHVQREDQELRNPKQQNAQLRRQWRVVVSEFGQLRNQLQTLSANYDSARNQKQDALVTHGDASTSYRPSRGETPELATPNGRLRVAPN